MKEVQEKLSASFLKKRHPAGEAKLLVLRALGPPQPKPTVSRSFLLLFFKKEALPPPSGTRCG